jgi:Amt family ammonium transporter
MFNGGSSLAIIDAKGEDAQMAMVNTILAPATGGIFNLFFKKYITGEDPKSSRFSIAGICNGVLAGAVCITASSNCVEPWAAMIIGVIGAISYCLGIRLLNKLKIDDAIDAFQVHGCNGFMGCILLAFFKKDSGIFYGGEGSGMLLAVQIYGCLAIMAWSAFMTSLFFIISNKLGTTRVGPIEEILGCDIHYFAPIDFEGDIRNYEIEMPGSPIRMSESPPVSPKRDLLK